MGLSFCRSGRFTRAKNTAAGGIGRQPLPLPHVPPFAHKQLVSEDGLDTNSRLMNKRQLIGWIVFSTALFGLPGLLPGK